MMFKRIVSFLFAVIVATSSAFAWDAYSFTGVYDVALSNSSLLADSDTPSLDSVYHVSAQSGTISTGPLLSYSSSYNLIFDVENGSINGQIIAFYSSPSFRPFNPPFPTGDGMETFSPLTLNYSYKLSTYDAATYSHWVVKPTIITYDLPVPDGASAAVVSFSPDVFVRILTTIGDFDWSSFIPSQSFQVDVYLNDSLYFTAPMVADPTNSLYPGYFLNADVFMSATSIDSIKVVFTSSGYLSYNYFSDSFPDKSGSGVLRSNLSILTPGTDSATIFDVSYLSPESSLVEEVGQAQDDINDHESIESQWTGSMSSNFDALDMDSFTFPSGLLSGFSLITGIFQDLWNGMGDYKILYVFPLFLGIALLLIGRISKFSGGQSSSRSNRGDDDA